MGLQQKGSAPITEILYCRLALFAQIEILILGVYSFLPTGSDSSVLWQQIFCSNSRKWALCSKKAGLPPLDLLPLFALLVFFGIKQYRQTMLVSTFIILRHLRTLVHNTLNPQQLVYQAEIGGKTVTFFAHPQSSTLSDLCFDTENIPLTEVFGWLLHRRLYHIWCVLPEEVL